MVCPGVTKLMKVNNRRIEMTEKTIDMRGRACPEPVIETQKVLKDEAILELAVLVDNDAAAENVTRTARHLGCEVSLETVSSNEIRIVLKRSDSQAQVSQDAASAPSLECGQVKNIVVLVPTDSFGQGDLELGRALLLAFVNTLDALEPCPRTLIFLNGGAKLPCQDSGFVRSIQTLEDKGTTVLVCGTCLDFFSLEDKLEVGTVSNMLEIVSTLAQADQVIRP